ncbi:hypothetical protein BP6252_12044 [Coleophoma cylindrospora]|uniref:Cupin type-2 domain-containing protein n=1 Tax=Coleophoma cylindrospora TaxID=1849047 RepID=A0A3D8QG18_9HELO|nr:hypothetical protein BP6252_12044 [Coleophoma cylindrospora]
MSSQIEELAPLTLAKAKAENDIDRHWTEVTYDGKLDSDVLVVPTHWHKHHDEMMEVLEGRLKIYLDGKEHIVAAGDPPMLIPRRHRHGVSVFEGERVRVTEKTIPAGEFKALFFQDMFQAGSPGVFKVFRASYDGDGYISLPGNIQLVDEVFITVVGFISKFFVAPKPTKLKRQSDVSADGPTEASTTTAGWFFSK